MSQPEPLGVQSLRDVGARMQRDWDQRAREDAHFYVAFGRRNQDETEFFDTASQVVISLERELKRLPPTPPRSRRALEIGCGPARLIKPMSRHFGEIHGVDVSNEMIERARVNLAGIPHAHVHHTTGSDLEPFADASFDFVYSYAVFQHIPSREVVMNYLREAHRVLKPRGILRVQINGLDENNTHYDTWSGVRIAAAEVIEFARSVGMQLLVLDGARTQYMWATMRKPAAGEDEANTQGPVSIRRITNAHSSEPFAPVSGRFAALSIWFEGLPHRADLTNLAILVDGDPANATYLGHIENDGLKQLNVLLPRLRRTGLVPVEPLLDGKPVCEPQWVRIIPPNPAVPVVMSITDGINMLAANRSLSGTVKVTIEEAESVQNFSATVGGIPVSDVDTFCADPLPPRFELNFHVPASLEPGLHPLQMRLGGRKLAPAWLEVES